MNISKIESVTQPDDIFADPAFDREQAEKLERGEYAVDRLPQETERECLEGSLRAVANVVARSHRTVSAGDGTAASTETERLRAEKRLLARIKQAEELALTRWSKNNGLLFDAEAFDAAWEVDGRKHGAEQQVYFDCAAQRYIKRNTVSYHDSYLEFFQRTAVHNAFFPEAAYRLEGFSLVRGRLTVLLSQPVIRDIRGASRPEIDNLTDEIGLTRRKNKKAMGIDRPEFDEFVYGDTGIVMTDLHGANVLVHPTGLPIVIDPLIQLDPETKLQRLRKMYGIS
jgi:hypothetical protein